jgi:hypothetical protein
LSGLGRLEALRELPGRQATDPIVPGIFGSTGVAFGLMSIPGPRFLLKFVPIPLLGGCYETVCLVAVVLSLLIAGEFPPNTLFCVVIFVVYIVGDLVDE